MSGWYLRLSLLYADLISFGVALAETSRMSKGSKGLVSSAVEEM